MNVEEEVRSRRLDAMVEEALGNGVPADLEERVLQRVRGVEAAPRRAWSAVAAITLLAGVLVVALVAWLRSSRDGVVPLQDPQKASDPTVIELLAPTEEQAAKGVDAPVGSAVARAFGIARGAGIDIVIAGTVDGESRVPLDGLTWREAVEKIAAEKQVGLAEYDATILLGVGQVPKPEARATFSTGTVRVADALKMLHTRGGIDLVTAAPLDTPLRLDVHGWPWRTVLDAVAAALGTRVVGRGNVVALARGAAPRPAAGKVPPGGRVYEFTGPGEVGSALDVFAHAAGANVFVNARVRGTIDRFACSAEAVPELPAGLAEAVHADVRWADAILHVEPRLANATGIALTAENMSLRDLVQMSWMTQEPNVEIADGVDAKVTVMVDQVPWFDVLRAAAVAAGRQFVRTEKGYRIE